MIFQGIAFRKKLRMNYEGKLFMECTSAVFTEAPFPWNSTLASIHTYFIVRTYVAVFQINLMEFCGIG